MPEEILRVPLQLKECRFLRTMRPDEFARFLVETELGSFAPDPSLGCRSPYFTPEYTEDLKTVVRNHVLDQFKRYMKITVNVMISDQVTTLTATFTCRVVGALAGGQRFELSWEV